MKRKAGSIIFLLILFIFSVPLSAQQVTYKVLKDDPTDNNNLWLYFDPLHFNFGLNNLMGTSFNVGLWGVANYQDKLGGEFIFRKALLNLAKLSDSNARGYMQTELGGYYLLTNKSRRGNIKVILSQSTSYQGDKRITTTRTLSVPGTKRSSLGVRAGFASFAGAYDNDAASMIMNYRYTGLYIGLLNILSRNLVINTDTDGMQGNFRYNRIYLDVLLMPMGNLKEASPSALPVTAGSPGVFGWRLGWTVLPAEERKMKSHGIKTRGMSVGVEAGMRPIDGFYFTGNFSIALFRKKLPALGYKTPAAEQNTFE